MATFMPETPPPAYTPPPLYEALSEPPLASSSRRGTRSNSHIQLGLSIFPVAYKLLAVDFFPETTEDRFPSLLERANSWLRANAEWRAQTCESVDMVSKDGEPNCSSVLFEEHFPKGVSVRRLRLWAVPNTHKDKKPQQLFYMNFVPKRKSPLNPGKFQLFNEVQEEVNETILTQNLNGRIISVETIAMKFDDSKKDQEMVDADYTHFLTSMSTSLFVLRVYYEASSRPLQTIEIVDFYPKKVATNSYRVYESIPILVAQAAEFCKQTPEVGWIGLQSIQMTKTSVTINRVDSSSMIQKDRRNNAAKKKYLRILRMYFAKNSFPTLLLSGGRRIFPHITCKTFVPKQIEPGRCRTSEAAFETTQQTLLRISRWVQENNARVVSAETSKVVFRSKRELILPSCTYSVRRSPSEKYVTVFRLYVNGEYPSTPPSSATAAAGSSQAAGRLFDARQSTSSEKEIIALVADCIFL